jgi:hypothetical protein
MSRAQAERANQLGWKTAAGNLQVMMTDAATLAEQQSGTRYGRNEDPDRAEFQLGIFWDFRQWGGNVGALGAHMPTACINYNYMISLLALGREAQLRASFPRMLRGWRRFQLVEEPIIGDLAVNVTLKKRPL